MLAALRVSPSPTTSFDRLSGSLTINREPVKLAYFSGMRQLKAGVRVKPWKKQPPQLLKSTFKATMKSGHVGVFERKRSGTARVARLPIVERDDERHEYGYVQVGYRFRLRSYPPNITPSVELSPFQLWLLDVSYRAYYIEGGAQGGPPKPGRIIEGDGTEAATPVRLDGSGRPLSKEHKVTALGLPAMQTPGAPGARIVEVPGGIDGSVMAVFLVYQNYLGADFSQLGL